MRLRTLIAGSVALRRRGAAAEAWWGTLVAEPGLSFAGLLRQLRAEARLTQQELVDAAALSPRSISDLERGINRTAREDAAELLADALSLAGPVRELMVAAVPRQGPGPQPLTGTRNRSRPLGAYRPVREWKGSHRAKYLAEGQPTE